MKKIITLDTVFNILFDDKPRWYERPIYGFMFKEMSLMKNDNSDTIFVVLTKSKIYHKLSRGSERIIYKNFYFSSKHREVVEIWKNL